jgi:hypothetical protein
MRLFARTATAAAALGGALAFSQAPEFAQQYQQRLGGALDELRIVVADFDRDAGNAGLDRAQALAVYDAADAAFLRSRGQSMRRTLARHDVLTRQSAAMAEASSVLKPFVLFRDADGMILANAWRDFRPAVPVTLAGILWALTGAASGAGVVTLARILRGLRRRRSIPATQLT